jgi:hypothetical protein
MNRSDDDKALWRRFADGQGSPPPSSRGRDGEGSREPVAAAIPSPPESREGEGDDLRIAAWLDGRLEGAERDAVEAWLAERPDRLDLALRSAEAKHLAAPWPKRAEARASALVSAARPSLRLIAAAAAAAILVAIGGFELGSAGSAVLSAGPETDLAGELGLLPDNDLMETLL